MTHSLPTAAESLDRRSVLLRGGALAVVAAATSTLIVGPALAQQSAFGAGTEVAVEALMQAGPRPDNAIGSATAPVTLVEYSSMTCPHCAQFHKDVLPALKSKYIDTGKIRYIVREFPLDDLATAVFMLARCLPVEKYFPFVDVMYLNQEKWRIDNPVPTLMQFAKQAGFSEEAFNTCLKDQKLIDDIATIRQRGADEFKVKSTPTFFMNGKRLERGDDIKYFDQAMAELGFAA